MAGPPQADVGSPSTRAPFPAGFWVTNAIEVLERTAYYGALAVAALRMDAQGLTDPQIGAILGLLLPLPFLVPIVSSALAERFGYKPMLLVAFALYAGGFLLFAGADSYGAYLAAVGLLGIGAGTFKPIPAATIGILSPPDRTKQGYSFYYAAINIGGLAGPLVAGAYAASFSESAAHSLALYTSTAAILLAGVVALVAFRNPKQPDRTLSVVGGFKRFGPGLRDGRFMLLLLIFSGFWLLYSMNFSFLSLYIADYVPLPGWFSAEMQNSVNPLVIVIVGVPLGLAAERLRGFASMTLGIGLFAAGFALIGFTQTFPTLVLGLVIATLGEILAYPGFLAHVAKVAGPERASAYQSLGFLPIGLGFFIGPFIGGRLFERFVTERNHPSLFWAILVGVALFTLAAMMVYDHRLRPKDERRRRAAPIAAGTVVALLLIPGLVVAAVLAGPDNAKQPGGTTGLVSIDLPALTGTTREGQTTEKEFVVPQDALGNLTFRLTWTDEAAANGATNRPDTFSLVAAAADGARLRSAEDDSGDVTLVVGAAGLALQSLTLKVLLVTAGDQVVPVPIAGDQVLSADDGNAWTLQPSKQVPAQPAGS